MTNETFTNQMSNASIGVAQILKEVQEIKMKIKSNDKKSLSTGRLGTKTTFLATILAANDHQLSKKSIQPSLYYNGPESDEESIPNDFSETNFKSDFRYFMKANRKYREPVRPHHHSMISQAGEMNNSTKIKSRNLVDFQLIL